MQAVCSHRHRHMHENTLHVPTCKAGAGLRTGSVVGVAVKREDSSEGGGVNTHHGWCGSEEGGGGGVKHPSCHKHTRTDTHLVSTLTVRYFSAKLHALFQLSSSRS